MQNDKLPGLENEKKFLKDFLDEARTKKIPVIDIETGRFLEFAVFICDPDSILEIGCGTGFSSYFLIKNLKNSGSYTGIDLNRSRLEQAEDSLKGVFHGKNLRFIAGNALELIHEQKEAYDFVFIDAAKFQYYDYLKAAEGKLTPDALVIADNIFYRGKMFKNTSGRHDRNSIAGLKKFLEYVTNNEKYRSFIMDAGDGLSVSIFDRMARDREPG